MQACAFASTGSFATPCIKRTKFTSPAQPAAPRLDRRRLQIRAVAGTPAPKGVMQPPRVPQVPPATFGFVDNAERMNSRACMIGFFSLIAVEFIAHRGLLEMMGLTIGKGLPFEF